VKGDRVEWWTARYGIADRDHFGHRFVADRERPGKGALRRHRQINVTASNGKGADQRSWRITEFGIRSLPPSRPRFPQAFWPRHR